MAIRDLELKQKALHTYVVKPGDTLKKISEARFGDASHAQEIYEANKGLIGNETTPLKPGTSLTIPSKDYPRTNGGTQSSGGAPTGGTK